MDMNNVYNTIPITICAKMKVFLSGNNKNPNPNQNLIMHMWVAQNQNTYSMGNTGCLSNKIVHVLPWERQGPYVEIFS